MPNFLKNARSTADGTAGSSYESIFISNNHWNLIFISHTSLTPRQNEDSASAKWSRHSRPSATQHPKFPDLSTDIPRTCHGHGLSTSMIFPRIQTFHDQSAAVHCPRPVHVRTIRVRVQSASAPGSPYSPSVNSKQPHCGRKCGHGQAADAAAVTDTDLTRTDRGCGHESGHLPGQFANSPRPFRGRRILVLPRGNACLVKNR